MGIRSWKVEFYAPISKVAKQDATQHSLTKWTGLRAENLAKHELCATSGAYNSGMIFTEGEKYSWNANVKFVPDEDTCALCKHHVRGFPECETCPLKRFLGERCDEGLGNPYGAWLDDQDPEPMIKALKGTLEMLKKEQTEAPAA